MLSVSGNYLLLNDKQVPQFPKRKAFVCISWFLNLGFESMILSLF